MTALNHFINARRANVHLHLSSSSALIVSTFIGPAAVIGSVVQVDFIKNVKRMEPVTGGQKGLFVERNIIVMDANNVGAI